MSPAGERFEHPSCVGFVSRLPQDFASRHHGRIRAQDHLVTATLMPSSDSAEIVRIEAGDTMARAFGLAIDIGTTTCALHLADLTRDHIIGTAAEYNGQIARGRDIISRINYARTPERLAELRQLVLGNLNTLIETLCEEHGVVPSEIDNAVVAGNTTMIHLLLGMDPEYIRLEPYTPTINKVPLLRGREVGLEMNPEAYVRFAPGVGSYVGGDITAGLLQTAMATDDEAVRLFLDIGTNGEIVVGNGEWLMACAASAGPAFEGSGVRCGMRASRGAIERIRIHPETMQAEVSIIGGAAARGICGSGMIDLLAELWINGLLDPSGKLNRERGNGLVRPTEGSSRVLEYVIVPVEQTEAGTDITIDELDIQNLLRTKAAELGGGKPLYGLAENVPGAYPLTWVENIMVPDAGLSADTATGVATLMRFQATAGQVAAVSLGEGSLPAPLLEQTEDAADEVVLSNCKGSGKKVTYVADGGPFWPKAVPAPASVPICESTAAPTSTTVPSSSPADVEGIVFRTTPEQGIPEQ
jgi:uncharacterized 2Fe-2S/4Fe-4S cluster protein (DUF4445 family)